jgi:hypothetical protein
MGDAEQRRKYLGQGVVSRQAQSAGPTLDSRDSRRDVPRFCYLTGLRALRQEQAQLGATAPPSQSRGKSSVRFPGPAGLIGVPTSVYLPTGNCDPLPTSGSQGGLTVVHRVRHPLNAINTLESDMKKVLLVVLIAMSVLVPSSA